MHPFNCNKSIINEKDDPTYDKITKSKWLVEACNELCGQFWNANQNLCVDEMMVKYTEKYSSIQQNMKIKPCRYGVKIWCLINVKSNFVQNMKVILVQVMKMSNIQLGTRLFLS